MGILSDLCYTVFGCTISVNQSFAHYSSAELLWIPSGAHLELPGSRYAFLAQVTRLLPTTYGKEVTYGF